MTKEHYNKLIQDIKNDKDFYVGQVDDLLVVKNSKDEKRVLSGHKDDWFGYWLVVDHPDYDPITGEVRGRLAVEDKLVRCETLIDVKRVADDLPIS